MGKLMDYESAKDFVNKVYDIWLTGAVEDLSCVYDEKIEANYFGLTSLGFSDIKNRFYYMRKNHKSPSFKLEDLVVDGNRLAIRSKYTAISLSGEMIQIETLAILHLNACRKVQKLWSMANQPVNYLEKA